MFAQADTLFGRLALLIAAIGLSGPHVLQCVTLDDRDRDGGFLPGRRAGTLPDFGHVRIAGPGRENLRTKLDIYDSYAGVAEMKSLAKGESARPPVWGFDERTRRSICPA